MQINDNFVGSAFPMIIQILDITEITMKYLLEFFTTY